MYVGPFVCSIYTFSSGFGVQYLIATQQCPHFTRLVLELSLRWSTSGYQLESKEG